MFLLLPFAVAAGLVMAQLRASLPPESGTLMTAGLSAPVAIERDGNGVPHIRARTDADAFFAVGYVHAQDRLWQLELQRRMVQGRLSEVFGRSSVERDIWFRTLGLHRAAAQAWPHLDADAQASLTAYVRGVNAWIASVESLPPEFRILGLEPQPWTEVDCLAWVKMFALDMGGNFEREISRLVAGRSLSATQLEAFFPGYPDDTATRVAAAGADTDAAGRLLALQHALERDLALGGRYVGSNAWAVSGAHTADGRALLANDPHLGLQIPSLWYAMDVRGDRLAVAGMSLVGLPVVVFGRNADVTWGGTNMMADAQDLYFEQVDPLQPTRYRDGDAWREFETRVETISVRQDFPATLREDFAPLRVELRATRHGPVLSDQYDVAGQPLSLRWTALDPDDTSYAAFFRMNYARDWAEFRAALALHVAPAMNMVYADRAGNVGMLGIGRIPVRSRGEGTLPAPGWTDEYRWTGAVPAAEMPQRYNPPEGYVVNANDRVESAGRAHFISHDFASPTRALRIRELLDARIAAGAKVDAAYVQRMQADTVDTDAAAIMEKLSTLVPADEHQVDAYRYVKDWRGDMRRDSQAAAIFHNWMRHFRHVLFSDELRGYWNQPRADDALRRLEDGVDLAFVREVVTSNASPWCDDVGTPEAESCETALRSALDNSLWEIYKLQGDRKMTTWYWGEVHEAVYRHLPFSDVTPLDRIFERRIASGGSNNTINVAAGAFAGADGFVQNFGAGFRQIVALGGEEDLHLFMNSTGQSGNVASEHYDDMVEPFRDVEYVALRSADAGRDAKRAATH